MFPLNTWYVAARSDEIPQGRPLGRRICNQPMALFRTELEFMIASTFPRLEQQTRIYKAILDAAGERPVTFRSLDVGGDKVLPYFRVSKEENPALGWRAIRMALDRPALFRTQVRALLRAAHGRELRIMLPMIGDVAELTAARALIDREGRYYVADNEVLNPSLETLKEAIARIGGEDHERLVTIRADGQTPHQAVVTAMDALGQVGFTHLSIATTPNKEGAGSKAQ